jgi:hypothetical protein
MPATVNISTFGPYSPELWPFVKKTKDTSTTMVYFGSGKSRMTALLTALEAMRTDLIDKAVGYELTEKALAKAGPRGDGNTSEAETFASVELNMYATVIVNLGDPHARKRTKKRQE